MPNPGGIIRPQVAISSDLMVFNRDDTQDRSGLDSPHPIIDGGILLNIHQQIEIVFARQGADEGLEKLLILGTHQAKRDRLRAELRSPWIGSGCGRHMANPFLMIGMRIPEAVVEYARTLPFPTVRDLRRSR